MKAVSSSIVVLAAAILLAVGAHVPHNDTKGFVMLVGIVLGLIGLASWYRSFKQG